MIQVIQVVMQMFGSKVIAGLLVDQVHEYQGNKIVIHESYVGGTWVASESETGLKICEGINKEYVLKRAKVKVKNNAEKIAVKKENHFKWLEKMGCDRSEVGLR